MILDTLIRILADDMLIIMIAISGIFLLIGVDKKKRLSYYARIILAGLTSLVVAKFMAALFQPEGTRPFEQLGLTPGASYLNNPGFPSDHALLATAIFFAVWFAVRKKWLTILLAVLVVAICAGRVLALVHTPLDVLGGMGAAAIGALWYIDELVNKPKKKSKNLQKHET